MVNTKAHPDNPLGWAMKGLSLPSCIQQPENVELEDDTPETCRVEGPWLRISWSFEVAR
jgi:hypothetical protein